MSHALRLLIVPRWAGHASSDFYPWLTVQVCAEVPRRFGEVRALDLPEPQTPTLEGWCGGLRAALGEDPALLSRTVVLGHSVGCQAALRTLAALPPGLSIAALLCVAGWWTVDRPWDAIRPWIEAPLDLERARAAAGRIRVLLSDNDPFTADHEEGARAWQDRLGAEVLRVPGARHFNAVEEPAVLQALLSLAVDVAAMPASARTPLRSA
jgi:uncharacterized protein